MRSWWWSITRCSRWRRGRRAAARVRRADRGRGAPAGGRAACRSSSAAFPAIASRSCCAWSAAGAALQRRREEHTAGLLARVREPWVGVSRHRRRHAGRRVSRRGSSRRAPTPRDSSTGCGTRPCRGPYASRAPLSQRHRSCWAAISACSRPLLQHCAEFARQLHAPERRGRRRARAARRNSAPSSIRSSARFDALRRRSRASDRRREPRLGDVEHVVGTRRRAARLAGHGRRVTRGGC